MTRFFKKGRCSLLSQWMHDKTVLRTRILHRKFCYLASPVEERSETVKLEHHTHDLSCFEHRSQACVRNGSLLTSSKSTHYISGHSVLPAVLKRTISAKNVIMFNKDFTSNIIISRQFSTSMTMCKKKKLSDMAEEEDEEEREEDILLDPQYAAAVRGEYILPELGHRVIIIQPNIKLMSSRKSSTTAELQLDEACALVETLPKWRAVEKMIIGTKTPQKSTIFGKGTFQELTRKVKGHAYATAVFVSTEMLSAAQLEALQSAWGLPVYDRYTVVLQIFKDHARTKEAKLQVALAEIPYMRSRLRGMHHGSLDQQKGGMQYIGGSGETYLEIRQRMLQERELKLKKALEQLKGKRHLLRKSRSKKEIPIVAVVGYTNAGKTSLIKALTQDVSLKPKNQLFATLDVTAHAGALPNHMTVIYMDTVGFISDIPTSLVESFAATLEDVKNADVIIHVRDISHPDSESQRLNVMATLASLELPQPLLESIIEVNNKADQVKKDERGAEGLLVSATKGEGLDRLLSRLQDSIIINTGKLKKRFKIPQQGQQLSWLYKEGTVIRAEPDENNSQFLVVDIIISAAAFAKFKATFYRRKK